MSTRPGVLIVPGRRLATHVAAARRHGFDPIVTVGVPGADHLKTVGHLIIDPDAFSELPLDDLVDADVRIWLGDAEDPLAPALSAWQRVAKRTLDVAVSVTVLACLLPLLVTVAIAIRADSPGPVLHTQRRIGLDGRRFTMRKFRTMHVDNEASAHREYFAQLASGRAEQHDGVYKIVDDPRVTRVGRILRKLSIDEMPQFLDVLAGSMSVVGPRPLLTYELPVLDADTWRRHGAKPGITGPWQVSGRSTTIFSTMIDLDVEYVREWTFRRDVHIILQTPAALLRAETA